MYVGRMGYVVVLLIHVIVENVGGEGLCCGIRLNSSGLLIWVNIDAGNHFLPDGTKPLSEPMLKSCGIQIRAISHDMLKVFVLGTNSKITNLSQIY